VPVVHVKGITAGQLKLTGPLLADIYMGKVARWNDEAIRKVNPDGQSPGPSHHGGVSFGRLRDHVGLHELPVEGFGDLGGEGRGREVCCVAGRGGRQGKPRRRELCAAGGRLHRLCGVRLRRREQTSAHADGEPRGKFVQPTAEAFTAAAANAAWKNAPGYYMVLTHQPGDGSWPITGASFILVHKNIKGAQTAKAMFKFFDWCYHKGTEAAAKLYYVPIPENVYMMVEETWKSDIRADGMPVWP